MPVMTVCSEMSPNFSQVSTIPKYWEWVNAVLIPGLYANSKYNGDRLNWRESLATSDFNLFRVGVGRLRQQRLKQNGMHMDMLSAGVAKGTNRAPF